MKADSSTTLEGHVVDVRKALVEYREASSRRDDTPAQEYCFDRSVPNRSSVQRRLSIYSWNTGCAVLFNKDTFFPDVKVKSIYLHDTRRELPGEVMEGDSGWVLQGVLSRVSFRRRPLSDQKHIHSYVVAHQLHYAKERGIGKKLILTIRAVMLDEKVDLVAGDFNSAAWRCSNRNNISTIAEAFADCALPMPPGPTPLWGLGAVPGKWADVGGFLNSPGFRWKMDSSSARRILDSPRSSWYPPD